MNKRERDTKKIVGPNDLLIELFMLLTHWDFDTVEKYLTEDKNVGRLSEEDYNKIMFKLNEIKGNQ